MFLAQFSSLSKILKVRKMYFCFSSTLTLVSQGFGLFYICMASHMSYWNGSRTIDMCFLKKIQQNNMNLRGMPLSNTIFIRTSSPVNTEQWFQPDCSWLEGRPRGLAWKHISSAGFSVCSAYLETRKGWNIKQQELPKEHLPVKPNGC